MREEDIQRQLRAIEKAGEIASQSRESALKFLRDAGIIPAKDKAMRKSKKTKHV